MREAGAAAGLTFIVLLMISGLLIFLYGFILLAHKANAPTVTRADNIPEVRALMIQCTRESRGSAQIDTVFIESKPDYYLVYCYLRKE